MKANSIAILGLQWGDEGKGKIIDYLSDKCDAVARFGGGANAGHTIVVNGEKFILRLLPSGVLHPDRLCLIGSGVACDPEVLVNEIEELEKRGVSTLGRIFVDFAAQLVLPLHKSRDKFEEASRGKAALDTTKRGIGPSYADRVSRIGVRVVELFDRQTLESRIDNLLLIHKAHLSDDKGHEEKARLLKSLAAYEPLFRRIVDDVGPRIMEMISSGKMVLFEGAQGSLLDVDFGTYPYATSSHTTIGGIFTGLGIAPRYVGSVLGVMKSYMTRVGHGPFPTELENELGQKLRERGVEFGSVTGRPRRTGWLDLVALQRMIKLNGVDRLAVTKLDVMDGWNELCVCEAYDIERRHFAFSPPNHPDFSRALPIYSKLAGWNKPVHGVRRLADLPSEARAYLEFIEERTGVPIWLVSTGSSRDDTIIIDV
jgi:adenylosuccinate synthase